MPAARLQEIGCAFPPDAVVERPAWRLAGKGRCGCQMQRGRASLYRLSQRAYVEDVALHRLDPDGAQDLGIRLAAHNRAHLVPMLAQARYDVPADYPRRAENS
jgi:hypothetical protein